MAGLSAHAPRWRDSIPSIRTSRTRVIVLLLMLRFRLRGERKCMIII